MPGANQVATWGDGTGGGTATVAAGMASARQSGQIAQAGA